MNRITLPCIAATLLFCPTLTFAVTFSDSFEAATLDPFWTAQTSNGNWFLSNAQAHTGVQSIRFENQLVAGQKTVQLTHSFAVPVYGTFSIWLRDPGAGGFLSFIAEPAATESAWGHRIVVDAPSAYGYSTPNVSAITNSAVSRNAGWHELEIDVLANSVNYAIDGQSIYTSPGVGPLSKIFFIAHDASSFPTAFFDDFNASWSAVPEPSTLALAAAGCALIVPLSRAAQRRRPRV